MLMVTLSKRNRIESVSIQEWPPSLIAAADGVVSSDNMTMANTRMLFFNISQKFRLTDCPPSAILTVRAKVNMRLVAA